MSDEVRQVLLGALAAGLPASEHTVLLDLGPDHPSRAGLLELRLQVRDRVVTRARVRPGAMHRGAEKLFEVRDYRQILMLADRHDWQAPFFGELAAVLTCEELLRLEAPPRAVWLRTLLAEHTRMLSHLGFLSWPGAFDEIGLGRIQQARQALREQTRRLTGNRIHPMATRIGGMACDPDQAWLDDERRVVAQIARLAAELAATELPGAGLAVVDRAMVEDFGLSGPMARAAGVRLDLRLSGGQLAYQELGPELGLDAPEPIAGIIEAAAGDARTRLAWFLAEIGQSARLVERCCDLPSGPVAQKLPKIIKLPEGQGYTAVEAPLGRTGFHVVSRGEKTPWRMKLRTPSFHHVAALERLLVGVEEDQVETVLASVGHVIGDLDK